METFFERHESSPVDKLVGFLRREFMDAKFDDNREDGREYIEGHGKKIKMVVLPLEDDEEGLTRLTARIVLKPPHSPNQPQDFVEVFTPVHVSVQEGSDFPLSNLFYVRMHTNGLKSRLWAVSELGVSPAGEQHKIDKSHAESVSEMFLPVDLAEQMFEQIKTYSAVESSE